MPERIETLSELSWMKAISILLVNELQRRNKKLNNSPIGKNDVGRKVAWSMGAGQERFLLARDRKIENSIVLCNT